MATFFDMCEAHPSEAATDPLYHNGFQDGNNAALSFVLRLMDEMTRGQSEALKGAFRELATQMQARVLE